MKKQLNLHRSYRRRSKEKRGLIWLFCPLLLLLTGGCVWGILQAQCRTLRTEIAIQEELLEQQAPYFEEATQKWSENEALMAQTAVIEELTAILATYPTVTTAMMDTLTAAGGKAVQLTLIGYDSSGKLHFQAQTKKLPNIPIYIQALRQTGLFHSLDYSGYVDSPNGYLLSLDCTLTAGGAP